MFAETNINRRTPATLRVLALMLLLFGAAFEAGHLDHHIRHAGHDHAAADPDHCACLVFHGGVVVEDAPDFAAEPLVVGTAPDGVVVRCSEADGPGLPGSRAPPRSS